MSVLDSIIEGVREDLAMRRLPLAQIREALESAPAVRNVGKAFAGPEISIIAEVKRSSQVRAHLQQLKIQVLWRADMKNLEQMSLACSRSDAASVVH